MLDESSARDAVRKHMLCTADVHRSASEACGEAIAAASKLIAESFERDGRLLLCGNGGSAADCQHIAAEFVSTLNQSFVRRALGAIALTTDTSFLTANANDFGFAGVFSRQVEALGRVGDVLIGITTSGNSENVIRAARTARGIGLKTVGMTGARGGKLASEVDVCVRVPSDSTQHIQESHIALAHALCALVERRLFGEQDSRA